MIIINSDNDYRLGPINNSIADQNLQLKRGALWGNVLTDLDTIPAPSGTLKSTDIINDLTTGGTTKVLSAEQGKVLNTSKQDTLISGTNIKSINGNSLLGSGDLTISSGGGITDITYSQLIVAIQNSTLTQGGTYRLTDFQTVHYMLDGTTRLDDINTGVLEPLILTATATNKISTVAKSELYPQDIIYYDWSSTHWIQDLSFATAENIGGTYLEPDLTNVTLIPNFKGVIFKRIDTKNNITIGYDFRNVKFRRWAVQNILPGGGTPYLAYASSGITNQIIPDVNNYIDCYTFHGLYGVICNVKNINIESTNSTYLASYGELGTSLSNNVFFIATDELSVYDIHAKSFFELNTFTAFSEGSVTNNIFNGYYSKNVSNVNFIDNKIGEQVYNNIFRGDFNSNTVQSAFINNRINDCYLNYFGHEFKYNTINNQMWKNIFGSNINTANSSNFFTSSLLTNWDIECEVYRRPDGQIRLKYMDNNDQVVITNVNA